MLKQVHLYIKGEVIGVGFRAWLAIQSKKNDIKGWARNVYNKPEIFGKFGGVEAVIQGNEENVKKILKIIKKGSPISRVDDIEIIPEEVKEIFDSFSIKKSVPYKIL